MRIFFSHSKSESFDYREYLYEPLKASPLAKEHTLVFPHDMSYSEPHSTKAEILRAGLIIAEVSYPSTSSGIELGWANDYDKKIFCLYLDGRNYEQRISMLTRNIESYSGPAELVKKIERFIKAHSDLN